MVLLAGIAVHWGFAQSWPMAAMPTNVIVGGVYFVQLKPDNQYGINLMAKSIIILHACL